MMRTGAVLSAVATLALTGGTALADHHEKKGDKGTSKKLEIETPEPQFDGTPKDLDPGLNLDPKRAKRVEDGIKRKAMDVPADVELLSRDKPVSSSTEWFIIGSADMITDGDKAAAPGSFVELGPGKQWVQIDLEKPAEIYAINIWHFHQEARVYRDVVVQISNDKDFEKDVKTVFNNDTDNSLGLGAGSDHEYLENHEGRLLKIDGVVGQYVRLYSKGNTSNGQNHYTEVEVFGRATDSSAAEGKAEANQKTAKADQKNS
jgi:hypothetical protein